MFARFVCTLLALLALPSYAQGRTLEVAVTPMIEGGKLLGCGIEFSVRPDKTVDDRFEGAIVFHGNNAAFVVTLIDDSSTGKLPAFLYMMDDFDIGTRVNANRVSQSAASYAIPLNDLELRALAASLNQGVFEFGYNMRTSGLDRQVAIDLSVAEGAPQRWSNCMGRLLNMPTSN